MLMVCGALYAQADTRVDQLINAGIAEFTAAYQAWDDARFQAAAGLFEQAAANAAVSATPYYWLGAAQFHRMLQLRERPDASTRKESAEAAMDAAVTALERAAKLDPQHAESHALLGTLYGMKIDGNLLRALRFGPRVAKHRDRAMEFGAGNARVRYLLGLCLFHTADKPAARRKALAELLAAEKLFELETQRIPQPFEPRWGRSSCRTFIGRTYELLGQGAEASVYYRQALAEHPADHLARDGLARVGRP